MLLNVWSPNPYDTPIDAPEARVSTISTTSTSSSGSSRNSDVPPTLPSRPPELPPGRKPDPPSWRSSPTPGRTLPSIPEPHFGENWYHANILRDQATSAVKQAGRVRLRVLLFTFFRGPLLMIMLFMFRTGRSLCEPATNLDSRSLWSSCLLASPKTFPFASVTSTVASLSALLKTTKPWVMH